MEILVLVKRVPATDSQIKPAADGKSYDPAGIEFLLNPYDEHAVEEALKTKTLLSETGKDGAVTVLTIDSSDAQKVLRTCLAMGADKAVLLEAGQAFDGKSLSEALAVKVKELAPDLIFCGKQAVDNDDSQIGPRLAGLLGWSCLTDAATFEIGDGTWTGQRDIEGAKEVVEGKLPAVICCNKGLNEPRYPNLKGIMAAKKKPLEKGSAELGPPALQIIALTPPPARPEPTILGEGVDAVDALMDKLKNEAKVL